MSSLVDPDHTLGFALKRLQQALRARMDADLAPFGLTTPQYAVLALLAEFPGIANAELARRSFVAPPTMIRMIASLADAGLIDRADRADGSRIRRVTLTVKGSEVVVAAAASVQPIEDLLGAHAGESRTAILGWFKAAADELSAATAAPDAVPLTGPVKS